MTVPAESAAPERQCARAVMMIRPRRFMSNPMTAESNEFQDLEAAPPPAVAQPEAKREFELVVSALTDAGVEVFVFDDEAEPHTPDAIFPNNWVSFHADGTAVLYPMYAENRRPERRRDIVEKLLPDAGFVINDVVDLSAHEREGRFLESTGSLILDRSNRIAYACESARTDRGLAEEFGRRLGYEMVIFDAVGPAGTAIYHTNVMMSVGDGLAVLCAESISDARARQRVIDSLRSTGHEIVLIDLAQLAGFAGNVLELENASGGRVLAMSTQARAAFSAAQLATLQRHAQIASADIDTIELCAGGSVRCMLAELHLPRTAPR